MSVHIADCVDTESQFEREDDHTICSLLFNNVKRSDGLLRRILLSFLRECLPNGYYNTVQKHH
jgi:hypothetical protein